MFWKVVRVGHYGQFKYLAFPDCNRHNTDRFTIQGVYIVSPCRFGIDLIAVIHGKAFNIVRTRLECQGRHTAFLYTRGMDLAM